MLKYFLLGAALFCIRPVSAQQRPHIILVLADDMGYSDLSCYGNPVIRTPFLDRTAQQGVRATNYVVPSPSCTPSRASLLTGRYASRMNLAEPIGPGSPLGMPPQEVTIVDIPRPFAGGCETGGLFDHRFVYLGGYQLH